MENNNGTTPPPTSGGQPGGDKNSEGENSRDLSLEQALLAPLNSILKAQLHSARSFLNLLLQLGYPHENKSKDDQSNDNQRPGEPYHMEFKHYDNEGDIQTLRVPALSLVPIAPLAVDSAEFELEMAVKRVSNMQQMQTERQQQIRVQENKENPDSRPWFLVDKPVSIEGELAPPSTLQGQQRNESQSSIKIKINVKSIPMPSGLDKLLTTLSHMGHVEFKPKDNGNETPAAPSPPEPPTTDKTLTGD